MKVDILKHRKFKSKKGDLYQSFMIILNNDYIWINQSDFSKHKDLLKIELYDKPQSMLVQGVLRNSYGKIDLKEPVEQNYKIKVSKTGKGNFRVLMPNKKKSSGAENIRRSNQIFLDLIDSVKDLQQIDEITFLKKEKNIEVLQDVDFINFNEIAITPPEELNTLNIHEILGEPDTAPPQTEPDVIINEKNEVIFKKNQKKKKKKKPAKEKFISDILMYAFDKKLTDSTRKKLLNLLNKHIQAEHSNQELLKRIERLEEFFLMDTVSNYPAKTSASTPAPKQVYTKNHRPGEMIKFLNKFSVDEKYKWFTHKPDLAVDKINYASKITEINNCLNTKKNIVKCLNCKSGNLNFLTTEFVRKFLNGQKLQILYPKFETHLTYANKEIAEKIKQGANPFAIEINGVFFVDIINRFKHAIEFRLDNDSYKFKSLLQNFITDELSIDISEDYTRNFQKIGDRLSTYIDVNNFFRGLKKIVAWINKYKNLSKSVLIDLMEKENHYELVIFHQNSYINRDINSDKINGLSGDMNTLRKYWFSVVDFEIQADLRTKDGNKAYEILCLNKETKMLAKKSVLDKNKFNKLENAVGGVKYIIKIHKN